MGLLDCQETFDERTKLLAANLVIGALLYAAWRSAALNIAAWYSGRAVRWDPGCNRPAPSTAVEREDDK